MVELPLISVIFPASPPALGPEQSMQVFPGLARLTWLKTLNASNRNVPFTRSVMPNDLLRAMSVMKKRGPRMPSRGRFPTVPQAGRAKPGPEGLLATVQKSVPAGALIASDGIGVKYVTTPVDGSR